MKKEQDNKPDFLRDINTAIMEDLTAGGIKDNAAGLAGELKEIEEVTELCGLRFNGYLAKIETPRPRGTLDEVIVAFTDGKVDVGQQRDGRPLKEFMTAGSKVIVSGIVQTLKDFESGKVLVFILADFVGLVKNPMMQGWDYEAIAEKLGTGKNTPRRWVTGIINELSVLLWGIDEDKLK